MSGSGTPFDSQVLAAELRRLPNTSCYWIAFSGGADSTALLFAMSELAETGQIKFRAVHVNHALHANAIHWEQHCNELCGRLGVSLKVLQINVSRNPAGGLEAEARRRRYQAIEQVLGDGDLLLTAHHLEDQAETMLLNLLRASGVDGLAAMPRTRPLGAGQLARPLLSVQRDALRAYLQRKGVDWLEDPSNQDTSHDRNFLRKTVFPTLQQRWPSASEQLARSADHCQQASRALAALARDQLVNLTPHARVLRLPQYPDKISLDLPLLIRAWLQINGLRPPPRARLEECCRQLGCARHDSEVTLEWGEAAIRHYNDHLWLDSGPAVTQPRPMTWDGSEALMLGGVSGQLEFTEHNEMLHQTYQVRFRSGGERVAIADGMHRRVKDLLREHRIPPWLRHAVPLLYADKRLLAIGDLSLDHGFRRSLEKRATRLLWTPGDDLLGFSRNNALHHAVDPSNAVG